MRVCLVKDLISFTEDSLRTNWRTKSIQHVDWVRNIFIYCISSTKYLSFTELNGSSIFCTGTKSQQLFRRFKPNMIYFIDVFGVHPKLGQLTFHLGSLRLYHSNKNLTIPLVDGRTGHGKLSQSNDLITFSYKVFIFFHSLLNCL